MIQDLDLQKIQRQLQSELARLLDQIEAESATAGRRTGKNLDRDDLARNFALREQRLALQDIESAHIAQIEAALDRIADGTYGTCASCGTAIAAGRLQIIPYAALCVRCQQAQEQN